MKYLSLLLMGSLSFFLSASSDFTTAEGLVRLVEAKLSDTLLEERLMSFKEALAFIYPRHAQVRLNLALDPIDSL